MSMIVVFTSFSDRKKESNAKENEENGTNCRDSRNFQPNAYS